jgi:predicted MPP superfamily phosphohydrolase
MARYLGASDEVGVERHEVRVRAPLGNATVLRIAFASDFHAGPATSPQAIEQAVDQLRRADADVVLFGGDFVSLRAEYARELIRLLTTVPARYGRFAVLGNHDYWADATAVSRQLRDAGIHLLTNTSARLGEPFSNVSVCGLDDHMSGNPDALAAFRDAGPVRIVLMHAPSGLLDVGTHRFDVALCGHTHGGQIALPSGRPLIVAHGRLSRRFSHGRHALDAGGVLLVSRGVGCSVVPIRLNAPAAVMLCTVSGAHPRSAL